jgi:methylglutaconyl-CoA hydratase
MSELVTYEVKERIGYITLNRPEKRNALSFEFVTQIKEVIAKAESDVTSKVIVLQANGNAFCSGADLAYLQELQNFSDEENLADSQNLMELFRIIASSSKIFISKVKGPALAGGCGLATVCDFSFATPESEFGYTEVKIGFVPAIVMVFLLRKVNGIHAREMMLTGEKFNAAKAVEYGLINKVLPGNEIDSYIETFALRLASTVSGQSVQMIKKMLIETQDLTFQEGLDYAAKMNVMARKSNDCKKGISAFLSKETLKW